jgi:hypothetical protein
MPLNTILHKCFKSPNPAVNVWQRNELVAMDTIQSNVPAGADSPYNSLSWVWAFLQCDGISLPSVSDSNSGNQGEEP